MNEKNFDKIVLVSLSEKFTSELGTMLSQTLGMLFCDAKELVEYELIDKKAVEQLCSVEYLEESERKVMRHIASFENVVVSISYDYLVHNYECLSQKGLIIFLKLPQSFVKDNGKPLDRLAYKDRTSKLQQLADISVSVRKTEVGFVLQKVIENLRSLI